MPGPITTAGQGFEAVDVCGDASFAVEAVDVARVHHRCRAADGIGEHAMQLMHETVKRVNGKPRFRVWPNLREQPFARYAAGLVKGQVEQQGF